ncbi:MAG TPA: DoxX family protein [Ohtaekwangia sp.]|uniref:DoxX family protein n=1 Tax=Ohtaekwangia sp. TaxID=2066019 RepID=UPI002F943BC7
MAPLVVLIVSYILFWLTNRYLLNRKLSNSFMGRVALALMLLMTGSAHFFKTDVMVQSMPDGIPYKPELVYFTGILELLAAVGLVIDSTARFTGIALIVFFVCVLPANIAGSLKRVALGGMENGPVYLYFRIPLQVFFIGWVYFFGVRRK